MVITTIITCHVLRFIDALFLSLLGPFGLTFHCAAPSKHRSISVSIQLTFSCHPYLPRTCLHSRSSCGPFIVSIMISYALLPVLIPAPCRSVEVRLSPNSTARFDTIRNAVHQYISKSFETIALPSKLDGWEHVPVLASSVEQITACESSSPTTYLPVAQASLQIHVYQPTDGDSAEGFSTGPSGDGEELTAASVCELPSRQWEGLWDSLIFPDDTKSRLLDYIYATVLFSDANVDCEFKFTHDLGTLSQLRIQSTLSRGTGSYYCMGLQVQGRLRFAGLSHRSSLSDCHTGMEVRSSYGPQGCSFVS